MSWSDVLDLVWLLFWLLILAYFWHTRRVIGRTQRWHRTSGRIIACEWSKHGHQIWPKIQYKYEVDSQEYIGEHLFLDTSHSTPNSGHARRVAYKVADAYKKDKNIDVYYDPEQPENAVLDVKIPTKLNVIILLVISFIIFHLVMMTIEFLK